MDMAMLPMLGILVIFIVMALTAGGVIFLISRSPSGTSNYSRQRLDSLEIRLTNMERKLESVESTINNREK